MNFLSWSSRSVNIPLTISVSSNVIILWCQQQEEEINKQMNRETATTWQDADYCRKYEREVVQVYTNILEGSVPTYLRRCGSFNSTDHH